MSRLKIKVPVLITAPIFYNDNPQDIQADAGLITAELLKMFKICMEQFRKLWRLFVRMI